MSTPPPQRILIVRLTALGDVIHGVPVLCALRDAFPAAHIAWVVEGRVAEFLQGHPALDEVVAVPRRWYKSPREISKLTKRLRASRYDTTIDLQGLTKSSALAWAAGATRRLGPGGRGGRELSRLFNNEQTTPRADHVLTHYLAMLRPLGIIDPPVRFDLPEHAEDARFAEENLAALRLATGRFAVLNPGAGWPSKVWPAERYGGVARSLHEARGLVGLAVWGTPDELPMAEEIVRTSHGAARLAPPTSVAQLAAISRRAGLFLGSDTGPMHLAVAVGTPTVSLHGASRAAWCGAYGPDNATVQSAYDPRGRRGDDAAMRAIASEQALEACLRVYDRRQERARRAG